MGTWRGQEKEAESKWPVWAALGWGLQHPFPQGCARLCQGGSTGGCRTCDRQGVEQWGCAGSLCPKRKTWPPGGVALEVQGGCAPRLACPSPPSHPGVVHNSSSPWPPLIHLVTTPGILASHPASQTLVGGFLYIRFIFHFVQRHSFQSLLTEVTFLVLLLTCSFF